VLGGGGGWGVGWCVLVMGGVGLGGCGVGLVGRFVLVVFGVWGVLRLGGGIGGGGLEVRFTLGGGRDGVLGVFGGGGFVGAGGVFGVCLDFWG